MVLSSQFGGLGSGGSSIERVSCLQPNASASARPRASACVVSMLMGENEFLDYGIISMA